MLNVTTWSHDMKGNDKGIKTTFLNLPEAKRQRILAAAVREFAANGYRKASLNTLVKDLRIAKGSIYRYFANKEALFFFVFDNFTDQVRRTVKGRNGASDENFFAHVENVLQAGILFIDRCPDYYQIYLRILSEHDVPRRQELIDRVRLFSAAYFAPLCDKAKEGGVIRADISTTMIIFLLDSVIDRFLQAYANAEFARVGRDTERQSMAGKIQEVIGFLANGLTI